MSYNISAFNDYIGREAKPLTKALFMGDNTALFSRVMTNVKGSVSVPHIGGEATLQKGTCPASSGTTPVTEVVLSVTPLVFQEEVCTDDLQDKFPNTVLMAGSHTEGDQPKEFEEIYIDQKVSSIGKTLAMTYWQGDVSTGSYQLFDGFIKKIDAGSPIDGNTSSATTLTKANVLGLVEDMITEAPVDVQESDRFVVYVGIDTFKKYISALKTANLYHFDPANKKNVYPIEEFNATLVGVRGLDGTDRMFAGDASNFILGNDLPEDEKVMKVIYDEPSDKTVFRSKMKAGTTVANIDEIVEFTLSA
ncbi:hypothetical protein V1387_12765 [Allomuricauda taeanensis]|uniref:hypothetical protein n=1 Tax=Flagellimonas taeanensis TaxID=1005926 RepID=UPI002E7AEC62|nr:hypothetical protein [Allomuricauda taeanensis]MEE1963562.1 hypothetical protein [Allomuricauda taeanensis]